MRNIGPVFAASGNFLFSSGRQQGFTIFIMMVIVFLVGVVAVSNLRSTGLTEMLAGSSIQRGRAMQSAEGGLIEGENATLNYQQSRTFSTASGSSGIFSANSVEDQWWKDDEFTGATVSDENTYPGVADSPEYITEEAGQYIADGGSGIVSLDRGNASYGRITGSGREVVLYKLQSVGSGSTSDTTAVVESLFARNL